MNLQKTPIEGVFVVQGEPVQDSRGFFMRVWCAREFEKFSLFSSMVQTNISHNSKKGTVRGMHFQKEPCSEAKLVSCLAGAIFDVALDLRKDSTTYRQSYGVLLSAKNNISLYIPEGCAHGFQTLEDASSVFYHMSEFYNADLSCGVRWNDPAFDISWPLPVSEISQKDAFYPNFII